jgi:hypothetical protein
MARQTRRRAAKDPKGETDFLASAVDKVPVLSKNDVLSINSNPKPQVTHVAKVDATKPANTLDDLRAAVLEDLAPAALEHIRAAIEDKGDKFTPEYKHALALKLLDRAGVGKQADQGRPNARADMVTLRAVSDRLGAILARCEARSDTRNVEELFG